MEPQDLIVDPYNGQADLRARVLRHVTAAFAEDPVRILRIARFSARFHDFSTAPETQQLMTNMVAAGEADALVPERVWQELSRGLMEAKPSRMLQTLQDCHALPRLLPQLGDQSDLAGWLGSLQVGRLLDGAAGLGLSLATRFAVWMSGLPIARLVPVAEHLRVPGDCRSLAELVQHERDAYMQAERLDAVSLVGLLERCDAWRRPARFADALAAWQCLSDSAVNAAAPAQQPNQRLLAAAAACLRIDAAGIAQRARVFAGSNLSGGAVGLAISHAIHAARVEAVTAL